MLLLLAKWRAGRARERPLGHECTLSPVVLSASMCSLSYGSLASRSVVSNDVCCSGVAGAVQRRIDVYVRMAVATVLVMIGVYTEGSIQQCRLHSVQRKRPFLEFSVCAPNAVFSKAPQTKFCTAKTSLAEGPGKEA